MACMWACTNCACLIPGDELPEFCPECNAGAEMLALWTCNDAFRQFPSDWTRGTWWEEGTGFRSGKIRGR